MKFKVAYLIVVVGSLVLSGCGLFSKKAEAPPPSNEIIDAGMAAGQPKKLGGGVIEAGAYSQKEDYTDLVQHGGKNGKIIPTEKFQGVDRERQIRV